MNQKGLVEVVLHGASNAIGSHEHPTLESGNLSFPEGKYFVDFEPAENDTAFRITHHVEGTPLVSRLIAERKAQYGCVVSSPLSSYRKIHLSYDSQHTVNWEAEDIGEPPLFTPLVVCISSDDVVLDSSRDGVHAIWNGQRVNFKAGSRIAVGNVIQLASSIVHLLSLHADDNMKEGQFAVDIETEPFRFRVNLHPDLHRFLRYRTSVVRDHVMVHIVTACLARLQQDFSEDDGESGWESHRNLKAFSDYLEAKELAHWTDEAFRPEKVATALYPLTIPSGGGDSELDDAS